MKRPVYKIHPVYRFKIWYFKLKNFHDYVNTFSMFLWL